MGYIKRRVFENINGGYVSMETYDTKVNTLEKEIEGLKEEVKFYKNELELCKESK